MRWLLCIMFVAACGSSNPGTKDAPETPHDAGPDAAPDASCFTNPTTNNEIINACTPDSVTKIYKNSHPPLLNPDGTLPPLP